MPQQISYSLRFKAIVAIRSYRLTPRASLAELLEIYADIALHSSHQQA